MREDHSDVYFARDQADWEAHQVPEREGWAPDPMHEYDGMATTYTADNGSDE